MFVPASSSTFVGWAGNKSVAINNTFLTTTPTYRQTWKANFHLPSCCFFPHLPSACNGPWTPSRLQRQPQHLCHASTTSQQRHEPFQRLRHPQHPWFIQFPEPTSLQFKLEAPKIVLDEPPPPPTSNNRQGRSSQSRIVKIGESVLQHPIYLPSKSCASTLPPSASTMRLKLRVRRRQVLTSNLCDLMGV